MACGAGWAAAVTRCAGQPCRMAGPDDQVRSALGSSRCFAASVCLGTQCPCLTACSLAWSGLILTATRAYSLLPPTHPGAGSQEGGRQRAAAGRGQRAAGGGAPAARCARCGADRSAGCHRPCSAGCSSDCGSACAAGRPPRQPDSARLSTPLPLANCAAASRRQRQQAGRAARLGQGPRPQQHHRCAALVCVGARRSSSSSRVPAPAATWPSAGTRAVSGACHGRQRTAATHAASLAAAAGCVSQDTIATCIHMYTKFRIPHAWPAPKC